jgi:hypothetical protein
VTALQKYAGLVVCVVATACAPKKAIHPERLPDSVGSAPASLSQQQSLEFEGLYTASYERSAFKPCNIAAVWWAKFSTDNPYSFFDAAGIERSDPNWESVVAMNRYLRVRGTVEQATKSEAGYGHMNAYRGQILITELLEARNATDAEIGRCRDS